MAHSASGERLGGMLRHARHARHAHRALAGMVPQAVRMFARPAPAAAPAAAPPAPSGGAPSSWLGVSSVRGLGDVPRLLAAAAGAGRSARVRQYTQTCGASASLWSRMPSRSISEEAAGTSIPAEQGSGKAEARLLENKLLKECKSSDEMRHVIETEMPAAGLEPDVVTFTTLVRQLMFEGDLAGALRVVEEDMPAAGLRPNDDTKGGEQV